MRLLANSRVVHFKEFASSSATFETLVPELSGSRRSSRIVSMRPAPFMVTGYRIFLHAEPRFSTDPDRARRDPSFADDELRRLIDEIHARDMYVVLDIVLNHAGNVFGYVLNGNDNAAK